METEKYKITIQKGSSEKLNQINLDEIKKELLLEIQKGFSSIKKQEEKPKKHKEIEEQVALFLEHYVSLVEYVKNAKEENLSKESLQEAEDDIFRLMMEDNINKNERESKFVKIFQNFQKTEAFVNFLTNTFNFYVNENIKYGEKIEQDGRKNRNYNRKYRTAILLKEHYMNGKELDKIGLYSYDVFTTSTSEYQKNFSVDRRVLIKELTPLLFGIDGIEILRCED